MATQLQSPEPELLLQEKEKHADLHLNDDSNEQA